MSDHGACDRRIAKLEDEIERLRETLFEAHRDVDAMCRLEQSLVDQISAVLRPVGKSVGFQALMENLYPEAVAEGTSDE